MKRLEWIAKVLLAVVMALVMWRPGRRARAARRLATLKAGARVLLVRIDNRVGEALLTTPLVDALAARGYVVHVVVHPKARRVLAAHPNIAALHDFRRSLTVWRALRRERFDVVINCGNWEVASVTSALVARLVAGDAVVLGPGNFPSGWLMDVGLAPRPDARSEALQRAHLAAPLIGELPLARLSFRATEKSSLAPAAPYAVVNPGGRLGFRRVPAALFAAAGRALLQAGVVPVVTWGPGEEALAEEVLQLAPGAVRAPPTDLDQLAALMRGARVTVCNNTGPMHLAVAVGCPTLALFLRMEVARWGHSWAPHEMVDLTPVMDGGGDAAGVVAAAVQRVLASPAA